MAYSFTPSFDSHRAGEVWSYISAALSFDDPYSHGPDALSCASCADFWRMVARLSADSVPALDALSALFPLLPSSSHPDVECVGCEGCLVELDAAFRTLMLAALGLPEDLFYSAPHCCAILLSHPALPADCPDCSHWLDLRSRARGVFEDAGLDASWYLGEDAPRLH